MPQLPPGYQLIALDSIDSTNEEARRRAPVSDRTVIWAKEQTAGRGRRGRAWTSDTGNLFTSIIVDPHCPVGQAAQLSFVAALAVSDVLINQGLGERVSLKWPNDVLVDGAKISGILLEASSSGTDAQSVIIGIGLNLASHPSDTPYPATDLASRADIVLDPALVLEDLISCFEARYTAWRVDGFAGVRDAWLARAHRLGGAITVKLDGETREGRFAGLDGTGALLLEMPHGTESIAAGDIYFPKSV